MIVVIGNSLMGLSALVLFWLTLRLGQPAPARTESGPVATPPSP